MGPETRVRARAVWDMVVFVLNGLVFILLGLQLSTVLASLSGRSLRALVGLGLLISLAVILVRLAWVFAYIYLPRGLSRARSGGDGTLRWQGVFVVGWAGMRGVVSLATALALPLGTPRRDLLLVLTFGVILVTLVGQGLSLPVLLRLLRVVDDRAGEHRELHARAAAAEAAVALIEELAAEWPTHVPLIDTLRAQYAHRASHSAEHDLAHAAGGAGVPEPLGRAAAEQELLEHRAIRRAVIEAERSTILALRRRGDIDDEVWRRIERDLDLEELRMEA
jgi:CPA1 family monovalent cation:H+ antiporter